MATFKCTVKRGQIALKDVVLTAGAAEAQSDTISLNVDWTTMRKGDVLLLIEAIKDKVHAMKFPPL